MNSKNKLFTLFILVLLLSAFLVSLYKLPITSAAVIFSSGFETGDFSEWDATGNWSTQQGIQEIQTMYVYNGTYAANLTAIVQNDGCYCRDNTADGQTEIWAGAFFKFSNAYTDNLTPLYERLIYVVTEWLTGVNAQITHNATGYYWNVYVSQSTTRYNSSVFTLSTSDLYWLELHVKTGTGNAEVGLTVNETEVIAETGLDIDTYGDVDSVLFGYMDRTAEAGISSAYVDCCVVSTTAIGMPTEAEPPSEDWFGGDYNGWYNVTWDGVDSWSFQQACDDAASNVGAADGSIVFVPAGNFTFDINLTTVRLNNARAGVQVTPLTKPMAIFGAGAGEVGASNETILYTPLTSWSYSTLIGQAQIILSGSHNLSIRVAGICFQGSVNTTTGADDDRYLSGIKEYGVPDYRIDHCTFLDLCNTAIGVDNNYINNANGNKGVIDHNVFDNPYKDAFYNQTGKFPYWAYGIIVSGDNYWQQQWRTLSEVLGQYSRDVAYIEDNSFRRCRHEIASSSSGGWYVARFNNFTEMILSFYASYSDVHGGGRGCEFYNNTITNCLTTYASVGNQPSYFTQYMGKGIGLRGGAGMIYNNTFINFGVGAAVDLSNDQSSNSTWRLDQVWIWDNTYTNVTTQLATSPGAWTIDEDDEYFLRAPTYVDDGFTYTPYPYPHPLVTEIEANYYTLTMESPSDGINVSPSVGTHEYVENTNQTLVATVSEGYQFAAWEIDGVNETTTETTWYAFMDADKTAKAYATADVEPPPPPLEGSGVSVALNSPASGVTYTEWLVDFTYVPIVVGDNFASSYLLLNGSSVEGNSTAIQNNTVNTLSYVFTANGFYNWNIQVWNSTDGVLATLNRTITISVTSAPNETITPGVVDIGSGMILHYTFDEGGGTTVNDHSGYGNDGTISGASWTLQGKFGGALSFDGVNDYVNTPNSSSLNITQAITLSAWIKTSNTSKQAIIGKGSSYLLYVGTYSSSKLHSYLTGTDSGWKYGAVSVCDGTFHFVSLTYYATGGENNFKLYVDGILDTAYTVTGNITATSTRLGIGDRVDVGYRDFFNGIIDEVRIYNRALSASEILDLYRYLTVSPYTGKVSYVFRPDIHKVNEVTGYKISETRNSGNRSASTYAATDLDIYFAYQVWVVDSTGSATSLTSSYSGIVYRSADGEGFQSSEVNVPETTLVVGFDAIKVVLYVRFGSGEWLSLATFVSDRLMEDKINDASWTMKLYTKRYYNASEGETFAYAYWGNTTCESGIANVEFTHPLPQAVAWAKGASGDLVGMILYPYIFVIGNLFYGLGFLFVGGLTYQKYRKFEPVLIMLLLFGGVGGLGFLIPDPAFRLIYIIVLFVIAFIIYRVFR